MLQQDERQNIYIAGIIDGEGYIGIRHRQESNSYSGRIAIDMTNPEPVIMIQKLYGGNIYKRKLPSGKTSYKYEILPVNQVDFLQKIISYMTVKKKQAELLIDFHNIKKQFPKKGITRAIASTRQASLFSLVKTLNA